MIRNVREEDSPRICEIYNHYVRNTVITFEEQPVTPEDMAKRIREVTAGFPWLVCEEDGRIAGYSYASKWKGRSAYRYTVESTVYVRHDALGKGIGSKLYEKLLEELRALGIHAVLAGLSLPNENSRRLHEKFGFVKVAHLPQLGYKFGKWLDVGYWELILDGSGEGTPP